MRSIVAGNLVDVKAQLYGLVDGLLAEGAAKVQEGASLGELEVLVGAHVGAVAARTVALLFAGMCRQAMERDLAARGLDSQAVRLRADAEGYATVHTTFGPVTFPVFSYRDLSSPLGSVTRYPARAIFPYHRGCRSSPLSLEWEARLGCGHPFRRAEELYRIFSRGMSTVEDTTIARHIIAVGSVVEPELLYKTPEQIRQILEEQATRDHRGRPLLYVSTDAHALRRYVDDTCAAQWKMVNGIRLWCEDSETGSIVHLGGEFLWGDCSAITARVRALIELGVLPNGDEAWQAVTPHLVVPSDGAEWIAAQLLPLLPDAEPVLDAYHLLDWVAEFARLVFGVGTEASRNFQGDVCQLVFGKGQRTSPRTSPSRRGGTQAPAPAPPTCARPAMAPAWASTGQDERPDRPGPPCAPGGPPHRGSGTPRLARASRPAHREECAEDRLSIRARPKDADRVRCHGVDSPLW